MFATKGRGLRGGFEMARQHLDLSRKVIVLDKSRQLAAPRQEEAERLLWEFEKETRGCFRCRIALAHTAVAASLATDGTGLDSEI